MRAALLLCIGCASALHKPPPIESIAAVPRTGAAQLLTEAEAAWARRAEPGQAAAGTQAPRRFSPRRTVCSASRSSERAIGASACGSIRLSGGEPAAISSAWRSKRSRVIASKASASASASSRSRPPTLATAAMRSSVGEIVTPLASA